MKKIAVFPGSFDPITRGHESVVRRAIPLFDEIIVAVGENSEKKYCFPVDQRIDWIRKTFEDCPSVRAEHYSGLTVDFCKKKKANYIIRGLRTSADFEFERSIGQVNKKLGPDIETIFMLSAPEYASLNSSVVREIIFYHGNITDFVPEAVKIK